MTVPTFTLRRKLSYGLLLAGVVIAVLAGTLELGLRLAGYGHSAHFARQTTLPSGEVIWRDNRWCTAPYFTPDLVRRPQSFRLSVKKEPGTYRIIVLGSSAAMGDPESSFSFGRILESMLREAYPQQHFEVVNAAITAINSHVTRGIAEDCAQLEPDLFIIYEGHNEIIGPFGPAGVFAPFLRNPAIVRTIAWLKSTRTGQLVSAAIRPFTQSQKNSTEWRGMQMFLEQQIAIDDPRLETVRAHFQSNLEAMTQAARRIGAPTLLCTVLTNQRDFAPFQSRHRPDLTAADLTRWQAHFTTAEQATQQGTFARAESEYRAALAIDDHHAELVYRLGRLALQTGRDAEAQTLLTRALDLDTLRFRTSSTLNQSIRDVAHQNQADVHLVDLAKSLSARSAHGIPGDDLLYEHVHLTFRGAYEVARELFPAVGRQLPSRGLPSAANPGPFDYETARRRLAYTTYEQAMIAIELQSRFSRAPFIGQSDARLRLQTWSQRIEQSQALLARPDALPALRDLYSQAVRAAPDDWILARNAGMMLTGQQAAHEALPLLARAHAWIDDDVDTLLALARTQQILGLNEAATQSYAEVHRLEPKHPQLPRLDTAQE